MKSREAKNATAERIAAACAVVTDRTASAQRLRERLAALALPAFDDAQMLAARANVEDLAAAVALGDVGKGDALRAARMALARQEALRDATAAAAREVIEARAGIERMIAEVDAEITGAGRERDEALGEWFAAELDAAERAYADAAVRASASLQRCYALAAEATRRGFSVKTAGYLRVADAFLAPVIGEHSAGLSNVASTNAGNWFGRPMRRIDSRETGPEFRGIVLGEVAALMAPTA